jgi:hypothetical protein
MKRICVIIFCFVTLAATAQDKKEKDFTGIVKFSPIQFLYNTFQLGFEQRMTNVSSFNISAGISYVDNDNKYTEGYIGEFQYRYYILREETSTENSLHNLYIGPYLNFKYFNMERTTTQYIWDGVNNVYTDLVEKDRFNAYNFGILAGINNVIAKRFHIDLYLGGGIRTSDASIFDQNVYDPGYKGIAPKFGFDLGINF